MIFNETKLLIMNQLSTILLLHGPCSFSRAPLNSWYKLSEISIFGPESSGRDSPHSNKHVT